MYRTDHPVYGVLQGIGKEITQKVKPKAVVVFSAHWMGTPKSIQINNAEKTDLIYEYAIQCLHANSTSSNTPASFYGFPDHFYKAKYPNRGDPALAQRIISLLGSSGIKAEGMKRGLDHGVWAGFHVGELALNHPENCNLSLLIHRSLPPTG